MPWNNLLFDRGADGIAILTINRPSKLNALNAETLSELAEAINETASAADIRALIITGAGEKAFVAGADIQEFTTLDAGAAQQLAARGQRIFRAIETLPKPTLAAVNGFALGGGCELAMACALRVAAPNAKFGQPEVKLGLIAGFGGTQRLPRLVGRGRALELLLTGDPIDAAEAYRIGLVNHIAPASELLPFAKALLGKILASGPAAVALTLEAVDTGLDSTLDAGLRFEAAAFGLSFATEDKKEGTRAFLEKRRAAFTGR